MYVNFLSTYSDKKSCRTSTTLQTSIARFVSGTLLKVRTILPSFRDIAQLLHIIDFVFIVSYFFLMSFGCFTLNINLFWKFWSFKH